MTTFRDSIDPRQIPPSDIVGGYGDGDWIWSPSWYDGTNGWSLHPEARHLVIVVSASHQGDMLDVETGDAIPAEAPGWVTHWNRANWRAPMLYCNRDTWPVLVTALRDAGIDPAGPGVDYLIATLDGTTRATPPPGAKPAVALQVYGAGVAPPGWTGGNYDEWIILDPSWVPGSATGPVRPAAPKGAASMWHPAIPGRWDDVVTGTNLEVYHTWGSDAANRAVESWGPPATGVTSVPGTERMDWTADGQHLLARVVGSDGGIYYRQVNVTGVVEMGWTKAVAEAQAIPAAAAPAPDTQLRNALTQALASLRVAAANLR